MHINWNTDKKPKKVNYLFEVSGTESHVTVISTGKGHGFPSFPASIRCSHAAEPIGEVG